MCRGKDGNEGDGSGGIHYIIGGITGVGLALVVVSAVAVFFYKPELLGKTPRESGDAYEAEKVVVESGL
ncbi:hypothetical protein ElyMa_004285600 [Elysia marginata]|uniref:Uncharacterized protein n=1 Tax=Elysia marginata TaxID=1093978 RepID=A0AAV4GW12_9GAST|nr:hypothetical protein ElyMa_004285600 [Elysia marginata]